MNENNESNIIDVKLAPDSPKYLKCAVEKIAHKISCPRCHSANTTTDECCTEMTCSNCGLNAVITFDPPLKDPRECAVWSVPREDKRSKTNGL